MKAFKTMLLFGLALFGGADAFTTKKREKRPAFKYSPAVNNKESKEVAREEHTPAAGPTTRFALPPSAAMLQQHGESLDEEIDVSYGTALVTCVLSLALGFGLGYGT
jgi:hypothetical protein